MTSLDVSIGILSTGGGWPRFINIDAAGCGRLLRAGCCCGIFPDGNGGSKSWNLS